MLTLISQLLLMLIIILVSAQLLSNALEYLGEKTGVSTGVTGSVFAAVATALPETIVPILAIVAGTSDKLANEEISVGAILGAPLMLSTLSTFLMAISVIRKRGIKGYIAPEKSGYNRDLNFFLAAFIIAAIAMYIPLEPVYLRRGLSIALIFLYVIYLTLTFKASKHLVHEGHEVVPDEKLIFTKIGMKNSTKTIVLQLILALGLLLLGAKGFINGIQHVSTAIGISTLLLSLLIIPLATELPEKVNSILWVRQNKDTLGFGNITGAMVFQGTLLPAIGILLTPWQPSKIVLTGVIITLLAAAWLRINASLKGISILALFLNGGFYLAYLYLTLK
jgi:cation:H+ antiporter